MYRKMKVSKTGHVGAVWALPYDLMETLGLKENDRVTLKFGSAETNAVVNRLSITETGPPNRIGLSAMAMKDLMMPENISVMTKAEGQNRFRLGPIVGILTYRNVIAAKKFRYYKRSALMYQDTGLLYVFGGEDIDESARTIKGYYYDHIGGYWKSEYFPFPDTVIDRIYPNKYSYHEPLENVIGSRIFNKKTRIDKMEFFNALNNDPELKHLLPDTRLFEDISDLEYFLAKYKEIYLKPVDSYKGIGIVKVSTAESGQLKCEYLARNKTYTKLTVPINSIFDVLEAAANRKRPYIVQQGILSMVYKNRPFSIRAWAMKNGYGHWVMPGMDARGNFKNGFLTNISAGSTTILLKDLFKAITQVVPLTKDQLLLLIEDVTLRTARTLDKEFGPLGVLGLDIMLDKKGRLWLLEANGNPGKTVVLRQKEYFAWPTQVYQNPLAYATYLAGFGENSSPLEKRPDFGLSTSVKAQETHTPVVPEKDITINTSFIIAEKTLQEVGVLETIAPPEVKIDKLTGKLTTPIRLEIAGETVVKTDIITDRIINDGYTPARLVIGDHIFKEVFIPFHSTSEISGIKPEDDSKAEITVESASVLGVPYYNGHSSSEPQVKLILRTVLKARVVVSRKYSVVVPTRYNN